MALGEYVGERSQMAAWMEKKGPEGRMQYRATRNRASIDGRPGLDV